MNNQNENFENNDFSFGGYFNLCIRRESIACTGTLVLSLGFGTGCTN